MRRNTGYGLGVVLGAIAFSVALFAFASSHWIWLSCVLGFLVGLLSVSYTTQNQSLLQIMTPRHLRGRVMSIYLLDRGLVPIGAILAGTLATHLGGQDAIRALALIALWIVVIVVATHPRILTLEVPLGDRIDSHRGRRNTADGGGTAGDAPRVEQPVRA